MSALLEQLLDPARRAECARHDPPRAGAYTVECDHCGPVDDHAGSCPLGSTTCPTWPRRGAALGQDTETQRIEPVPGTALQWVRFVGIPWRSAETPRRRRADPPHPSRFGEPS